MRDFFHINWILDDVIVVGIVLRLRIKSWYENRYYIIKTQRQTKTHCKNHTLPCSLHTPRVSESQRESDKSKIDRENARENEKSPLRNGISTRKSKHLQVINGIPCNIYISLNSLQYYFGWQNPQTMVKDLVEQYGWILTFFEGNFIKIKASWRLAFGSRKSRMASYINFSLLSIGLGNFRLLCVCQTRM